jgi:hypothetical protein
VNGLPVAREQLKSLIIQLQSTPHGVFTGLSVCPCPACELMPCSAKARELLPERYAPAEAAARASLPYAVAALESEPHAVPERAGIGKYYRERQSLSDHHVVAYRKYS